MGKLKIVVEPVTTDPWYPGDRHVTLKWGPQPEERVEFWLTKKARKRLRKALK